MADFDSYYQKLLKDANDPFLRTAVEKAITNYRVRKETWLKRVTNIQDLAKELKNRRREALDHLEENIKKAVEIMQENGMKVYQAKDAHEACSKTLELIGNEKLVTKVKSLTTEEIGLNEFLEEHGIEIWETDVGAVLLQVAHRKAAHPTGVSISVPKEVFAEYFSKLAGRKLPPDPNVLVAFVRDFIREKSIKSKVAVSGANAITADTGTVYLVTNEGNDRLVTSLPEKHIIIAGIDKVMPDRDTANLYCQVMPLYTTGHATTQYITQIMGISSSSDIERLSVKPAAGPAEIDVILLDNGRRKMAQDADFKEAFTCLRCGTCLYDCPVWNLVAHDYGEFTYMGGLGVPWTLFTLGLDSVATQAFSCTQCGRCKEVCPMEIDTPKLIRKTRSLLINNKTVPKQISAMLNNTIEKGSPYIR
ncbi:MAG: LUD domain-containing protein [Candidatus Atabeyarchaeum deiterrae]